MSPTHSVFAPPSALAHPGIVTAPASGSRHECFIREKLVLTSIVLAALPLGLAFHGVPSPVEAAFFAAALLPLAAAVLVARSGRLLAAQGIAILGEIAIALLVASVAGTGAAIVWLVVALFECTLAPDHRLLRGASLGIALAAGTALAIGGMARTGGATEASAVAALCALFVGMLVSWRISPNAAHDEKPEKQRGDRAAAITDAVGDAVAVFDVGGLLIDALNGLEEQLDAKHDELAGRGFFDLINVADRPTFLKLLGDASHDGNTTCGTLRLRTAPHDLRSGEPRTLVFDVRAHACGNGAPSGTTGEIIVVLRDVTEAKRREAEIDSTQRSIDTAFEAKDHFLANMSHELRTPLNAIIGFSEMLGSRTMSPHDPSKQREYAGIIHQSGQHLLSVLNAILDMSKIQSGTFALMPEPFPLLPLVAQCCDAVRPQAQNGRVEIISDVPPDLEEIVADRRACRQVLTNLLSNAVKFTPPHGRVTLRIRPQGTGYRIVVSDTGIGIGEADLVRLGDPFFQARSSLSRPYEGTGLGLSLTRGLVGLHGGTLAIESECGKGTSVTVRLPLDCRLHADTADAVIEISPRRGGSKSALPFETRRVSDTRVKQSA